MSDLVKIINNVANCDRVKLPFQIMNVCRLITPKFYKGMNEEDINAELSSIQLLTCNIDNQTLSKMCELAVKNYPLARASNDRTYFDVNYILTFYKEAFNEIWCDNVDVTDCFYLNGTYDEKTSVITEKWQDSNGNIKIVKEIVKKPKQDFERVYSKKHFKTYTDDDYDKATKDLEDDYIKLFGYDDEFEKFKKGVLYER